MKSLVKTAAILGTCLFVGGAYAEGNAATTTGMKSPQSTDTTSSPTANVPSANSDSRTDTYGQDTAEMNQMDHDQMNAMNKAGSPAQVRSVQSALSSRGYDLSVDGIMGKNTTSALSRFQKDQGLTETGRLDDATLRALNLGSDYERVPSSVDDDQMNN